MGLLRPLKRYISVALGGLILLVLLYTIIIEIINDVDENYSQPKGVAKITQVHGEHIFERYWQTEDAENFTEILLKSVNHVRFENKLSANRYNLQLDSLQSNSPLETRKFDRCRMSNCFDFSRCRPDGPLKVYIVPSWQAPQDQSESISGESNVIHRNILKIIRQSNHFESNPEKACIFILEDDTLDRDPLSLSFKDNISNRFGPSNNYGMNHLIFNLYSGSWPDYKENDFAGLHFGAAIIAKSSNSILYHRPGFDISLPLFAHTHPFEDQNETRVQSEFTGNRSYFITFKGKRYVFGKGSETRNSIYHLDNKRDILMLTTCRHGKKWRESSDARCQDDEKQYDKYDFVDLMKKSTFCLTPRGRRLGSFRYLEALSHGCIPVILSDGWVKPFDEIIDWKCASIQFPESLLLQVPDMLKDLDSVTANRMRDNCFSLYDRFFSSTERIILSVLSIIERRVKNYHQNLAT